MEYLREEPGAGSTLSAGNNALVIKRGLELAGLNGGPGREPLVGSPPSPWFGPISPAGDGYMLQPARSRIMPLLADQVQECLRGVAVGLLTPFDQDLEIDHEKLAENAQDLYDEGIRTFLATANISEYPLVFS